MLQALSSERLIATNGAQLQVVEQSEGPAVVFCYGFPDGWRSWLRRMRAVSHAGFRAVAFDMRGHGDSSAPPEVTDYSLFKIAGDIVGLGEALKGENACLVGHDFGAASVWTASLMRPDLSGPCSRLMRLRDPLSDRI